MNEMPPPLRVLTSRTRTASNRAICHQDRLDAGWSLWPLRAQQASGVTRSRGGLARGSRAVCRHRDPRQIKQRRHADRAASSAFQGAF
jgi:hypothetical protein